MLNKTASCTIQLGGSDQWGNILAGIELVNKLSPAPKKDGAERVFGITIPLLTTPSGEKFGKSAGNAVALDESISSVFDFYQVRFVRPFLCFFLTNCRSGQFFLRIPDSQVGQYLKLFTLLPISQIEDVMNQHEVRLSYGIDSEEHDSYLMFHVIQRSPEMRTAQRLLASEVTELVHGGALGPCVMPIMIKSD